jgi:hypothetical protein
LRRGWEKVSEVGVEAARSETVIRERARTGKRILRVNVRPLPQSREEEPEGNKNFRVVPKMWY